MDYQDDGFAAFHPHLMSDEQCSLVVGAMYLWRFQNFWWTVNVSPESV